MSASAFICSEFYPSYAFTKCKANQWCDLAICENILDQPVHQSVIISTGLHFTCSNGCATSLLRKGGVTACMITSSFGKQRYSIVSFLQSCNKRKPNLDDPFVLQTATGIKRPLLKSCCADTCGATLIPTLIGVWNTGPH